MCGIIGHFIVCAGNTDVTCLTELIPMMSRRGPDDEGLWTDGERCALGFRRLSILDLSPAGHQPMLTQDGRFALVFNGEVYNFVELRGELEHHGVRFRSSGDAEVVLYALAIWGKEALNRFNGMFALGFYDAQEKRLMLARDHAGIKPLYYLLCPQGLLFASQYDQILAHSWSHDLTISQASLGLYLRLGYIPAPYAILDGTHLLPPGTWLKVGSSGEVERGAFFEMPAYTEPELSGQAAYEAINEAVSRAVNRHLVSDVPVGLFLSGGIDSPVVAAKLRDAGRQDIPAFTIGSDEDRFDETQEAMAYAKELDLKHHVQVITPRDALDMLEGVTAACSEPFADYSIFPTMLVSRLASQHVKVVLSGDGGDELFWGYVPRFQAVLRRTRDFAQPRWLRQARWLFRRHIRVGNAIRGLCEEDIGAWYLSKHSILLVGRQNGIFPDLGLPEDFTLFDYRGYEPAETAQWLRWNEFTCHLPGVLLKVDRASMYHSLEVRVPLLDREVIAVAGRIDWESCLDLQNGMGKLPLRHVLSRAVSHQSQAKRGFSVPMANWLREDLRPIFEDCVCNRTELIGVPLQPGGIQRLWKQHLSGQANHERALWALLSLALWEARHLKPAQKVVHPHD